MRASFACGQPLPAPCCSGALWQVLFPQELDGTSRCAHLSLGRAPAKLTGGCGAVTSITFRCLTVLR